LRISSVNEGLDSKKPRESKKDIRRGDGKNSDNTKQRE